MGAARWDQVLSPEQMQLLTAYVAVACEYGHGRVSVEIKGGLPRYISVELQETLDRSALTSHLARLLGGDR